MTSIRALIQARMTSKRFPGKVLAPFRGEPIISHVIGRVRRVLPVDSIVVVTSNEASDDPLVAYVKHIGINVFRGARENVLDRFIRCVDTFPCDWILRICSDSPLLNDRILQRVLDQADQTGCDLVSTTFPRTFPKGQNAELIRTERLKQLEAGPLTAHDREHVTSFFYRNSQSFRIMNIESGNKDLSEDNLAVDTVEDLHRLETLSDDLDRQARPSLLTCGGVRSQAE